MFNITCLDQNNMPIRNFTQWDMGQSILIDGLTLDKPPQVHYWNAQSTQAYVDDKVTLVDGKYKSTVPNALLMSAIAIYVAIYPFDSATPSGRTIAQVRIGVNERPKPGDYVLEDNVDIVYIKDLIEEIDVVKNTFADGVKNTVSDAVVVLDDSSAKKCEIEILGKTVQEGEPTPDTPIEIKGVGESGNLKIVERGRNLCLKLMSQTVKGITVTSNGDGSYTINGTTTDVAIFGFSGVDDVPLPAGKYYVQVNNNQAVSGLSSFRFRIAYDGKPTVSHGVNLSSVNAKSTLTTSSPVNNIEFRLDSGIALNNLIVKPQIEFLGYSDFEKPKELYACDIPLTTPLYGLDKPDRICKKDGVGGIERWCKVLDSWANVNLRRNDVWSSNANMDLFYISNLELKVYDCISNILKKQSSEFKTGIHIDSSNALYFCFDKSYGITTVELLKKYLTEHNCKVIVRTDTPTFEPFSEDIQAKLNALTTYYGTTVLYTTDDLQPTVNVNYVADTKLYINKQIKNAVAELQSQLANTLSLMPLETQAKMIENDTNNLLQTI